MYILLLVWKNYPNCKLALKYEVSGDFHITLETLCIFPSTCCQVFFFSSFVNILFTILVAITM